MELQGETIFSKWGNELKKATSKMKCSGELLYYEDNLFMYVKVSDQFSKEATKILANYGFEEALSMKTPGSPKIHVSILTSWEQKRSSKMRMKKLSTFGDAYQLCSR